MSESVQLFWALLGIAALAAARWGGTAERVVSIAYMAAMGAGYAVLAPDHGRYLDGEVLAAMIDAALLLVLLATLWLYTRWWLFGSAVLQMLTVVGHVAKAVDRSVGPFEYFISLVASSYPALVILLIGVWRHRSRCKSGTLEWT